MYSPTRRLSGLSPAYADGILVCPTGAGALVAVDLATRSLLWGYCYSQNNAARRRAPFFAIRLGVHSGQQPETRWSDPIPIVVDGRVLMTPTDSDTLYCLNLEDGKQCWTARAQEDLYLACVHKGEVILVGRTQVRACPGRWQAGMGRPYAGVSGKCDAQRARLLQWQPVLRTAYHGRDRGG